jgi:hypothetical protein
MRNACKILVRKPELGISGRIKLEWILGKYGEVWTGFNWLRMGTNGMLL